MFDKYCLEIKEKPFIISFLILSIISCVVYSYNFFPMMAIDDEFYQSGIFPYFTTKSLSATFHQHTRFPGVFLATILSDGTVAKNMSLFLNLIATSFLSILFTRQAVQIKSIFWSIVLSIPIIINAAMQPHYFFVINLLRFIPVS